MVSIILLSGAQVFLYPEGLKSIWVRPEMGGGAGLSLVEATGPTGRGWHWTAIDLKQQPWTHSLPFLLPPAHLHQTLSESRKSEDSNLTLQCSLQSKPQANTGLGAFVSPSQKCPSSCLPSHYLFPIIENNANIFNGPMFLAWKMILRKKNSLIHTMPLLGFFGIKTENPVFCTNLPITSF